MTIVPVRTAIADPDALPRAGLAHLLAEDERVTVVGQAATGDEALELCRRTQPDVLLLDRDVRHGDALSVTRDLARACLATRVLMLCRGGDGVRSMDVVDVLRAGAYGYVQKDAQLETVVLGLVAARAGDGVITGSVARIAFDERVAPPTRVLAPELTPREREVLTLVGGGATTKQIARRLGIVEKTVRNHLSHIYEKLQLMDRSQVALYAVRKGLVEL